MKNLLAESPRFPCATLIGAGLVDPKARQKCVVDGQQVNIPVPCDIAMGEWRKLS